MIVSFRHKGLRQFFEQNDRKLLQANMIERIMLILTTLHASQRIESMRLPSFRLHPLKGEWAGFWSVTVRANWRIVFRFEDGKAFDVDFLDYH
jgi:toxin HigB-1